MIGKVDWKTSEKKESEIHRKVEDIKLKDEEVTKNVIVWTERAVELTENITFVSYGYLLWIDRDRLTKLIFNFFKQRITKSKWFRSSENLCGQNGVKKKAVDKHTNLQKRQVEIFFQVTGEEPEDEENEENILHGRTKKRSQWTNEETVGASEDYRAPEVAFPVKTITI